jgi:hypothetical protein
MAESELEAQTNSTDSSANPAAQAPLPPTPQPQKVVDKKFIAVMAAVGAAKGISFATSTLIHEREREEGAPWATSAPSNISLTAKHAAIFAGEVFVAYQLKKPHSWLPGDKIIRKLWWVYPVWTGQIHSRTAIHNVRMRAPAGCILPECQPR